MKISTVGKPSQFGKRVLLIALIAMVSGAYIMLFPATDAFAFLPINQTTVADFNTGFFFHTGLTRSAAGGGDGDGEVRLLTIGINPTTWNPGGTANTTGLPGLYGHAAAQNNGYIYVSGGKGTGGTTSSGVYYTAINSTTHNLSNWTTSPNSLPTSLWAHGMVALNNYLYVIGGLASGIFPTNTVRVATINPGGSIGAWSSTASLPSVLSDFTTIVVSGTIYVVGGDTSGTSKTPVYYTTPNPSTGTISSWSTATAPLPKPTSRQSGAGYAGTIYQFGGTDLSTFYPDVLHTTPSGIGDVTSWITDTGSPLPSNLIYASAVAFGGQAYVAGGAFNNGASLTTTIASNLINPDGSILNGSWAQSNVLSTQRQRTAAVLSDDGWIYVIEGNSSLNGIAPLTTIDYGPTSTAGATSYAPSGTYTSRIFDLGASANLQTIKWNTTVTSTPSLSLSLQYRTGTSLPLGSWSSIYGATPGTLVTNTITISQTTRYLQYQVNFTTTLSSLTPVLNSVQIIPKLYPSFLPLIRK